jgi:hypothetical protein
MNRHGELVDSASAPWLILVSCFTFLEVLALFGKLTGTIGIPLFFFGFCGFSLLQWWPCSLLTRCLLGVPMVYVLMNMLFYPSFFLSDIRWFYQIFLDIAFEMVQWRWEDVFSFDDLPHIRSLFFFMFLWLVSMGWTRWFQSPHRRLFLFCCSFLFVALIDFGTEIDVGGAPLRLGFMMLLLSMRLHAARVLAELPQWDQLPANWWWWGWSLLVILGLVAWALPKAPSTWELDLMRYLPQGQLQEDVRGKQTGYRQGDGVLGGSVKQDMRVAFRAQLEMPYYWRGESLEIYTGSRWLHAVGKTSLSFEHLPSSADFRNLFTGVSTSYGPCAWVACAWAGWQSDIGWLVGLSSGGAIKPASRCVSAGKRLWEEMCRRIKRLPRSFVGMNNGDMGQTKKERRWCCVGEHCGKSWVGGCYLDRLWTA